MNILKRISNKKTFALLFYVVTYTVACTVTTSVFAERLKDISDVQGVRSNQLIGYGLVVGLNGTGDQTAQTPFTLQTFKNMMSRFGITVPDNVTPQLKNIAAVAIHADIPAFAKPGQRFDITVSSIGNAKSLRGGTLLMSPLKGADQQVYAMAQGNLVVSGFGGEGADGSKITVNIPSAGSIPGGAIVEREIISPFTQGDSIVFNLHRADFTNVKRVADGINRILGPGVARAVDAASIRVSAPQDASQRVAFLSVLENMSVNLTSPKAQVVINSRTGTIVIGENVVISPVAVSHGNLIVTVEENINVSQPNAFSDGETAITANSQVQVEVEDARMFVFDSGTTLNELVQAVNAVGAAPGDLMAILEALRRSGALKAELVVI